MEEPLNQMRCWSDDRLLREANAGNEKAFAVFCEKSIPSLYRYIQGQCRKRRIPVDLAEEFCHDAILKALSCIQTCQNDGGVPLPTVSYAWMAQVAFNVLRDWQRRNRRVKHIQDEMAIEARPQISVEELEQLEETRKFFHWLSNRERDILELVLVSEMSIIDAGAQLGMNRSNSYRVYKEALSLLHDLIEIHGSSRQPVISDRRPSR